MKTILAPIDFSDVSKRVIKEAVTLARAQDARVVLMNVTQPPYTGAGIYDAMIEDVASITGAVANHAAKHLARLKAALAKGSVEAETIHDTGYPVALILEQARRLPADLIVLGSHGHTALYDLLVGSVANGVLHQARCPVVVVPAQKKKGRG